MDEPFGTRLPADDTPPPGDRRRRRLRSAAAALVAAAFVCLPFLLTKDDPPHEWAGVVMLLHTALTAILVLAAAGLLLLLGRARPTAAALGKGAVVGVLLGGVIWNALVVLWPSPPPADQGPTPIRTATAPANTAG